MKLIFQPEIETRYLEVFGHQPDDKNDCNVELWDIENDIMIAGWSFKPEYVEELKACRMMQRILTAAYKEGYSSGQEDLQYKFRELLGR